MMEAELGDKEETDMTSDKEETPREPMTLLHSFRAVFF